MTVGPGMRDIGQGARVRALLACRAAQQTTNLATGDHVQFSATDFAQGSSIALSAGAYPLNGRFVLQPRSLYKLTAWIPYADFTTNNGWLNVRWGVLLSGVFNGLGHSARVLPATSALLEGTTGVATAFFDKRSSVVASEVELRLVSASAVAQLGLDASQLYPSCLIEEL